MAQIAVDKSVDVGSGSTSVLSANPNRQNASFVNNSDEDISLSKSGDAVIGQGTLLIANGGSHEINKTNPYYGPVTAICLSGAKRLSAEEL